MACSSLPSGIPLTRQRCLSSGQFLPWKTQALHSPSSPGFHHRPCSLNDPLHKADFASPLPAAAVGHRNCSRTAKGSTSKAPVVCSAVGNTGLHISPSEEEEEEGELSDRLLHPEDDESNWDLFPADVFLPKDDYQWSAKAKSFAAARREAEEAEEAAAAARAEDKRRKRSKAKRKEQRKMGEAQVVPRRALGLGTQQSRQLREADGSSSATPWAFTKESEAGRAGGAKGADAGSDWSGSRRRRGGAASLGSGGPRESFLLNKRLVAAASVEEVLDLVREEMKRHGVRDEEDMLTWQAQRQDNEDGRESSSIISSGSSSSVSSRSGTRYETQGLVSGKTAAQGSVGASAADSVAAEDEGIMSPVNAATALHRVARFMEKEALGPALRTKIAQSLEISILTDSAMRAFGPAAAESIAGDEQSASLNLPRARVSGDAQFLANVAWALSKIGRDVFFAEQMDVLCLAAATRVRSFSPQNVANFLQALASARHMPPNPKLLLQFSARSAKLVTCFSPRELVQVLWACATLAFPPVKLLKAIDSALTADPADVPNISSSAAEDFFRVGDIQRSVKSGLSCLDYSQYELPELTNCAWAYAVFGAVDSPAFVQMWEEICRQSGDVLSTRASLLQSHRQDAVDIWNEVVPGRAQKATSAMDFRHLSQIYQVGLTLQMEGGLHGEHLLRMKGASELLSLGKQVWRQRQEMVGETKVSRYHERVEELLRSFADDADGAGSSRPIGRRSAAQGAASLEASEEAATADAFGDVGVAKRHSLAGSSGGQRFHSSHGAADVSRGRRRGGGWLSEYCEEDVLFYSVDLVHRRKGVIVEVDGPTHFARSTNVTLGGNYLKRRHLAAAKWKVATVPFFQWECLAGKEAEVDYLRRLLSEVEDLENPDCSQSQASP